MSLGGKVALRGAPLDERGLRQTHGKLDWWEQLHHFYVLVALAGTFVGVAYGSSTKELVLLLFLGGYIVVIALFSALSSFVNGEKARYAPIVTHVHSAMHSLRNLRVLMQSNQFESDADAERLLRIELTRVLDSLRSSFEIVTGTAIECRVELVKRPVQSTDLQQLGSYALVRDSVSAARRGHMDEDTEVRPHPVVASTPYMALLHGENGSYYFCGDVFAQQDFGCEYFKRFPSDLRPRSMIVWPIRYRYRPTPGVKSELRRQEIVGFLHVESSSRGAFNRRYDVELGAVFADSLFDVLFVHVRSRKDVVHAILNS